MGFRSEITRRFQNRNAATAWRVVFFFIAIWGVCLALAGRGMDLGLYIDAAGNFIQGLPVYDIEKTYQYMYLPSTCYFFIPLTVLPLKLAVLIWNLLTVTTLFLIARQTVEWLESKGNFQKVDRAVLIACLVLLQSIYLELFYGQINIVILFLLVTSLSQAGKKPYLSGFLFALAVSLKPPALVVGFVFLWQRQYRVLLIAFLGMGLLWLPVLLRYGWTGTVGLVENWRLVVSKISSRWVLGYNNQGLVTLLLTWLLAPSANQVDTTTIMVAQLMGLGLLIGPIVILRPKQPAFIFLVILAGALLSPLAWIANFIFAFPLLCLGLSVHEKRMRQIAWLVAILLVLLSLTVQQGLLGKPLWRMVLKTKPYTITALLLFGSMLWYNRRSKANV
jgi:hypothetical protein